MTASPIAGTERAVVRFGEVAALDSVSVAINPGEITALTGWPGSGKTTLMRVLAGILPLDSGSVYRPSDVSFLAFGLPVGQADAAGIPIVGRCLDAPPSLVLAEEPTHPDAGRKMVPALKFLRTLADGGSAVVVASHDAWVVRFADRVLLLDRGRIVEDTRQ